MNNTNFDQAAWEAFQEAATDKYDFTTCQRPDGSKYGSNGRCIKGSETTPASKDSKKGSGSGGGGGAAEQLRQINAQEGRGGGVGKNGRSPVGKTGVISKKEKAEMSKNVKALDKTAKAADKKAEAADKKWRKGGMKDKALQKEVRQLDRTAKAANKEAERADKAFQKAIKK